MLKIRLFGTGQAKYFDHYLDGFPNQHAFHLLCYLMLNRRYPNDRERLAATFWGDYPAREARKHLRNALWKLRLILQSAGAPPDQYFFVSDESITLVNSDSYWLDVDIFENAILSLQDVSCEEINLAQVEQLEAAVNLYTGDLLDQIYDDWCLYDRERLRTLYRSASQKLLQFHTINSTYEQGLDYGRRLLNQDPTLENVHRHMMVLYWLNADPSAALAQYRRCSQIMHEEFGSKPLKETNHLYEQMLHNRVESKGWLLSQLHQPAQCETRATAQPTAHFVEKLHDLQKKINETRAELNQLEDLIQQSLLNSS